ncbi:unnamed protein product, partial [Brassica oleracea]
VVVPRYAEYEEAKDVGVRKRYKVTGQDILKRMVLFCKAAVEVKPLALQYHNFALSLYQFWTGFCVQVPWYVPCGGVCYGDGNLDFIANDWHTALLPVYLKAYYRDHGLMKYTRSVLVIHNIASPASSYMTLWEESTSTSSRSVSKLRRVLTVSHGYSWEVKTLEGGWGLHSIINEK